jgi:hypothetical protein
MYKKAILVSYLLAKVLLLGILFLGLEVQRLLRKAQS